MQSSDPSTCTTFTFVTITHARALLRDTARQLTSKRTLPPCAGYWQRKSLRNPVPTAKRFPLSKYMWRVFVVLSGKKYS